MSLLFPLLVWVLVAGCAAVSILWHWWAGPAAAAVLLLATWILLKLLMRGKAHANSSMVIDGEVVPVEPRYGSKLPKALFAGATTINTVICCRSYPESMPQNIPGVSKITRRLIAHEACHVVSRHRKGPLAFWSRFWIDVLKFIPHDQQREEAEAIAATDAMLNGTFPDADASVLLALY